MKYDYLIDPRKIREIKEDCIIIVDQMHNVQNGHQQFQGNGNQNALNFFKYMQDNNKITPHIQKVKSLDISRQSDENREITMVAKQFEKQVGHSIDIDLNRKIIYYNSIMYLIEKRGGVYHITTQNPKKEKNREDKNKQLVKVPNKPSSAA